MNNPNSGYGQHQPYPMSYSQNPNMQAGDINHSNGMMNSHYSQLSSNSYSHHQHQMHGAQAIEQDPEQDQHQQSTVMSGYSSMHQQSPTTAPRGATRDRNDSEDPDSEENSSKLDDTKGRRKIRIEYIEDKSRRHITFSKRKAGIMKKAYELSTLTGTQVLLLVVSETGLVYTFTTPKLQPLVTKPEGKNIIQSCLNAPEPLGDGSAPPPMARSNTAPMYLDNSTLPSDVHYEDPKMTAVPHNHAYQSMANMQYPQYPLSSPHPMSASAYPSYPASVPPTTQSGYITPSASANHQYWPNSHEHSMKHQQANHSPNPNYSVDTPSHADA